MKIENIPIKGIIVFLLLCLTLTACGIRGTWTSGEDINLIQVSDNSDFELIQTIAPKSAMKVFAGGALEERRFTNINHLTFLKPGIYAISIGDTIRGMRAISIYETQKGITNEAGIAGITDPNFTRVIYDEMQERILWVRHDRNTLFERAPDELIALNMELEELWRIHTPHYARAFKGIEDLIQAPEHIPFYIVAVEMANDFYYVVSTNSIRYNVQINPSPASVTVVYRVDMDGTIVDVFRKENFEFLGMTIKNDLYVVYGVQVINNRFETIVIFGNQNDIFASEYKLIQAKNIVTHSIVANDTLMITGMWHHSVRGVETFITLIDLNTKSVTKTLDLSQLTRRYEIHVYGFFYGEDQKQIGLIGTNTRNSNNLGQVDKSIIFIPINENFEVNSIFSIDVGKFNYADIVHIAIDADALHMVSNNWHITAYQTRNEVIEFYISNEQLMSLQ